MEQELKEVVKSILSDQETAVTIIKATAATYKPIVYSVLQELFGAYKELIENDEYFTVTAQARWKRYNSLCKAGFTADQAMSLMLNEDSKYERELTKALNSISKSTEKISKSK